MNNGRIFFIFIFGLLAGGSVSYFYANNTAQKSHHISSSQPALSKTYICPMHAHIISKHTGNCPICGMDLVLQKLTAKTHNTDPAIVNISAGMINILGVKTAKVKRQDIIKSIEAPGFVQQIHPHTRTIYRPKFSGRNLHFFVTNNQWIEKGDKVVSFNSDQIKQAQKKYIEQLNKIPLDKKDILNAKRVLRRFGFNAQDIQELASTKIIHSPFIYTAKHAGRFFMGKIENKHEFSANDYLFEIKGLVRAIVLANAFQRDAAWIKTGQACEIRMPHLSGKVWPGIVNQGAVSINPSSQNIGVKLSFTAPVDLIKSSMYVVSTIYGKARKNVLSIPEEALMPGQNKDYVIVALDQGRFKPVEVIRGIETDGIVEIISGLNENDTVVTSSQFLIDSESQLQASFLRLQNNTH